MKTGKDALINPLGGLVGRQKILRPVLTKEWAYAKIIFVPGKLLGLGARFAFGPVRKKFAFTRILRLK